VIQLKKNTMYIIVAVLVVVIIIAGAAAYILSTNGNGGTNSTPTPTPTPAANVANATTLTFSANVTSQGQTTTYEWKGTNIHAAPTIRVDLPGYSYILNSTQEKSWSSTNNGSTWTQGTFTTDWPFWGNEWSLYVDELTSGHWDGISTTHSYTDSQGQAITLFNIVVNPTIPSSTFATS
jgi:hypothetical protein